MSEKTRSMITGAIKAFLYGCAIGGIGGLVVFLVGWLYGTTASWYRGYRWAVRVMYVAGGIGLLVGSVCMFATGGKTREEQLDPNNYEVPAPMEHVPGISWPVAVLWGSVGVLAMACLVETIVHAMF